MGIDAKMYVVTEQHFTPKQIKRLSYEAGCAFGADRFFRWLKDEILPKHHNISKVNKIEQDGPDWNAPDGHTILRVHVGTRYYGPGYERGDLPFLVILAEWLERKIPGCQIMYGGDSSGVLAEKWGPRQRAKYLDHFASEKGRAYFDLEKGPVCPHCGEPMDQYMWGGVQRAAYSCGGCGHNVTTNDGGRTFEPTKKEQ